MDIDPGLVRATRTGQQSWWQGTGRVLCCVVCVGIQLGRLRQVELKFWASLGYVIRLYPNKQKNFSYELSYDSPKSVGQNPLPYWVNMK